MLLNSKQIVELCITNGFALAGIASAKESKYSTAFEKWISQGKQGEMEWMKRNVDVRLDPNQLLEGAQSVLCVADRYGNADKQNCREGHGKIARYAQGRDYHKVMKKRLHAVCDSLRDVFPNETFRACVDTAPIMEREFAERAGLGSIGKHTLLLEQGIGSWLLLGVIVTTATLQETTSATVDPCASCFRCIEACPTEALTPWDLDARRCISYLTIEHRSEIDAEFYDKIGHWIFGCDICQEVCPHNQPTEKGECATLNLEYEPTLVSLNIAEVIQWDEESRRNAFQGSSMKRAKLGMMRRNAVIVAGNILAIKDDAELFELIKSIADQDEDEIVRLTAKQVLQLLTKI